MNMIVCVYIKRSMVFSVLNFYIIWSKSWTVLGWPQIDRHREMRCEREWTGRNVCVVNFTTYLARLMPTNFGKLKRKDDTQCYDNNNNNKVTLLSCRKYSATKRRTRCIPYTHSYLYLYCTAHRIIALIFKLARTTVSPKSRGRYFYVYIYIYKHTRHQFSKSE